MYTNVSDRETKYKNYKSKLPLVVFGAGMFGKDLVHYKGLRSGVTELFYKTLKRRESNGDLIVVTIDEYLTSQVCSKCMTRTLDFLLVFVAVVFLFARHVKHCSRGILMHL
ncbi:uncharacterized protein BX663DRAFT_508022 [Cokeromyces recurvatus]|uniref:uncharacterized protein n=1 Tax=Cokeromyces recurvatus TaxID=90255 RepID=UPI002220EBCE|nr:uncharacterized protein BX663DRAFT_508022 [Cokeromyces recurvatus]KAI7903267.1 hypothetical protein BX663DRAFT_508022 [Cokeromyces recurvatus]